MQNEQTVEMLNKMKLYGMAETLPGRLADARQAELTHAEFVGLLAADEQAHLSEIVGRAAHQIAGGGS